jgi:Tfp pilus assembly protein PilN
MRAVNLIPSEQRPGGGSLAGRSGGGALIVLGTIVAVAVLAALYGGAAHQISKESGEVAELQQKTSEVQARTGRLTPYTSFVAMAEQRTKTVAQLVQARFDWSHALHELGRVLPGDSSLLTLQGSASGTATSGPPPSAPTGTSATPASSTPPGSTPSITLTGCSRSQAEVAQTLQRLRLMDGVTEVHLANAAKSSTSASGSPAGGCGQSQVSFEVTVTYQALPATPIPTVAAPAVAASTTSARGAHAEQTSATTKGTRR